MILGHINYGEGNNLSININLEGLGKYWAMRNFKFSGIFCKWDCENCDVD